MNRQGSFYNLVPSYVYGTLKKDSTRSPTVC